MQSAEAPQTPHLLGASRDARPARSTGTWLRAAAPLGLGVLALGVGGCAESPRAVAPPDAPDVVLVVVDTLRADAVAKAETPWLDALAEEGARVPHAWSPSTWTAPSTLSLMMGAHVREHGWDLPFPRFMAAAGLSYPAIDDRDTLAEVLRDHGYTTLGFYANPLLSRELGWQRGFDVWEQVADLSMHRRVRRALRDLDAEESEGPRFTYVHLLGPHQPLQPSRTASRRWGVTPQTLRLTPKGIRTDHARGGTPMRQDQYIRSYHALVEDTDARVETIVAELRRRERPTLVILTSDHGELLGEHDSWGHESSVWNPLTHVPLVVGGEAMAPVPELMSTAALPDYITQTLSIDHTWPLSIDDPPILVSQRDGALAVSSDGLQRGVWAPEDGPLVGVFDLYTDPGEERPRVDFTSRSAVTLLRTHWELGTPADPQSAVDEVLDDETKALLEELGYMGGGTDEP